MYAPKSQSPKAGQVAEWLKASVLKADIPLGIVGSTPTLSYFYLFLLFLSIDSCYSY